MTAFPPGFSSTVLRWCLFPFRCGRPSPRGDTALHPSPPAACHCADGSNTSVHSPGFPSEPHTQETYKVIDLMILREGVRKGHINSQIPTDTQRKGFPLFCISTATISTQFFSAPQPAYQHGVLRRVPAPVTSLLSFLLPQ